MYFLVAGIRAFCVSCHQQAFTTSCGLSYIMGEFSITREAFRQLFSQGYPGLGADGVHELPAEAGAVADPAAELLLAMDTSGVPSGAISLRLVLVRSSLEAGSATAPYYTALCLKWLAVKLFMRGNEANSGSWAVWQACRLCSCVRGFGLSLARLDLVYDSVMRMVQEMTLERGAAGFTDGYGRGGGWNS